MGKIVFFRSWGFFWLLILYPTIKTPLALFQWINSDQPQNVFEDPCKAWECYFGGMILINFFSRAWKTQICLCFLTMSAMRKMFAKFSFSMVLKKKRKIQTDPWKKLSKRSKKQFQSLRFFTNKPKICRVTQCCPPTNKFQGLLQIQLKIVTILQCQHKPLMMFWSYKHSVYECISSLQNCFGVFRGGSRIFSREGGFSKTFREFWRPFFLGRPNWFSEVPVVGKFSAPQANFWKKASQKKPFLGTFQKILTKKSRFLLVRAPPSKLVNIGLQKNFRVGRQKMDFLKSIKGGTLLVGRGSNPWEGRAFAPPPLNPLLGVFDCKSFFARFRKALLATQIFCEIFFFSALIG